MNALTRIAVDTSKLNAAMATFPRDRTMIIDGREAKGSGEMIERALAGFERARGVGVGVG